MTGYSVEIKETSRELTAKQRIALKDTSDAIKLDIACDENSVIIEPVDYAVLSIHNEKTTVIMKTTSLSTRTEINMSLGQQVFGVHSWTFTMKCRARKKLGQSKHTSLTVKTTKERNSLLVQLSR